MLHLAAAAALVAVAGPVVAQPAPAWSERARQRLLPGGDAVARARFAAERSRLLSDGETALQSGRADEALRLFERAALMLHAADTELGIVRAQMGLGQYRRAVSFCAHAAGAHRDQPGGMALYAWLLNAGGQARVAQRLLDQAIERRSAPAFVSSAGHEPPGRPLLQVRAALQAPWPTPGAWLLQRPWRAAPDAWCARPTDAAAPRTRVIGSAVLLADGAHALAPRALVTDRGPIWLRNGLGQTVAAAQADVGGWAGSADADPNADRDLVLLVLASPMPSPTWTRALREPYAGSAGGVCEYANDPQGQPAWPLLHVGFFAGMPGVQQSRPLGIRVPDGPHGGPVLDAAGRWVGVALPAASEAADGAGSRLVGIGRLVSRFARWLPVAGPEPAAGLDGFDAGYESALRATLQVLALPGT